MRCFWISNVTIASFWVQNCDGAHEVFSSSNSRQISIRRFKAESSWTEGMFFGWITRYRSRSVLIISLIAIIIHMSMMAIYIYVHWKMNWCVKQKGKQHGGKLWRAVCRSRHVRTQALLLALPEAHSKTTQTRNGMCVSLSQCSPKISR